MKKIAVFTGSRAEYGLLYWVIKGLNDSPDVQLQLFVGGMHMSKTYGHTIDRIVDDGFDITDTLEMMLSSDTPVGITKSMGVALIGAADMFERHKPDILVLLGDRFEAMAIAQAAMVACIPIAHIHGGESTEGVIDEAARHSITKMSHLHFVATEEYRHRVIQLGEHPDNIFNYGAPGIDSVVKLNLARRDQLSELIDFNIDASPYFMVTYHPVTLEADGAVSALQNMLDALDQFPDHKLIITYPNSDTHGHKLIEVIEQYMTNNQDRALLVRSLGQHRYLSALKHCSMVIGNSSSGLIEAPTFNVPTVNIGNRQLGRIRGQTVIDCLDDTDSIVCAINQGLSEAFLARCETARNPYGDGTASQKIVQKLLSSDLNGIIRKSFYDLNFQLP